MRSLPRGLTSLAVSALLVLAPLSATAAFADEPVAAGTAPVVEEQAAVDAPAEELVEETPTDVPAETVDVPETPAEPGDTASPEQSAPSARAAAASPSITVTRTDGLPITLSVTGLVLTASWTSPTGPTGEYYLYDFTAQTHIVNSYGSPSLMAPIAPGHLYEAYFNNASGVYAVVDFTLTPPAPNSAENLAVTRLATANGFALSWDAPADNTDNPVTNYEVEISDGASSVFVDTAAVSYVADGLTIGTTYGFSVVAESSDGQRSNGIVSSGHLLNPVPPTAPGAPLLSRVGGTLTGTWTAPYDGGYPIDHYVVEVLADGVQVDIFAVDGLTFDFEGEFGIAYSFRVYASTPDYDGAVATSTIVEHVDSAPATPTAYAEGYGYKNAMIYTTWDAADEDISDLETAVLTVYNVDGSVAQQKVLNLAEGYSGWSFEGLPNDTDYTVGVVLTNAAGSSIESLRVPARTLPLVPPAETEEEVLASQNYATVTASLSGTQLTAHLDGVDEGEWVFGYAYSTPSALGWTQVDANGFARWSIAGAGLATGATHTLAVQNSFGAPLGFAAFAVPGAVTAAALAFTGTDSSPWIAFGAGMIGLGALLMMRRRARA